MEEIKKKKAWYKKWWVWLIIIVVIGAIGSMNSEDKADKPAAVEKQPESEPAKEPATTEPKKEVEPVEKVEEVDEQEDKTISKVGDSISTKNFKLTVESLNKLEGNDFNKPADGNKFVEVVVLIENISDKDYTVSSLMMFNAYQDGFSINESIGAQIADTTIPTLDGALAAGKKLKGKLAYELPKDWSELEIDVDLTALSFSSEGEVKIILKNK
ncbi:hypothetical protein J2T13_001102 [Paenibacillus sp. DS2015]|uniref:DUF4352 domain-containing protein n=1 Tax=Paenibacillus sp. DS2015 TaxID=3373917 RepID=UPI003D1FAF5F